MGTIRHLLVIVLAVGALIVLSAVPALAKDDHGDTGRPCGSLFDAASGDAGECGVLNLIFPPTEG